MKPTIGLEAEPEDTYFRAQALYDFDAETPDEMSMKEGEILQFTEASRDGSDEWVYAYIDDREGWIPLIYIQKI